VPLTITTIIFMTPVCSILQIRHAIGFRDVESPQRVVSPQHFEWMQDVRPQQIAVLDLAR
jgi:hypothetical protein